MIQSNPMGQAEKAGTEVIQIDVRPALGIAKEDRII
jgi:hypothetical protein